MGFPAAYSELLLLPKLFLHFIFFLGFVRRLISSSFNAVGLGNLLDYDAPWPDPPEYPRHAFPSEVQSMSAALIQKLLPAIRFADLPSSEEESDRRPIADGCAVCLYGFEPWEEVRRLSNCRHVFHRQCLDRWVEHDQRICPLCRTLLVPEEMQEAFNLRIWAHAEVFYSDVADDLSTSPFISPVPFPPPSPPLLLPVSA
ncbi:RING-H2 finger protein ATL43 [Platanthera zijinensis]|uniref:RING-H2 finger protein ATL43 n=1 Tax=Platanthera zijinensis TaxID=2320716 RepID=A0AAP0C5N9_9ASPA